MRPFRTVGQAVRFYHVQAGSLARTHSPGLEPRIQEANSARREEMLALCISVSLCLDRLGPGELDTLDRVIADPQRKISPDQARIYHRAMTKLGREMRRRELVG